MVSVSLKVRHDHCGSCGQGDSPLYLLDITAGQPLTIRPSDPPAGFCVQCVVTMGVQMVDAGRALLLQGLPHPPPPPPSRPLPPSPALRQPDPTSRIKG